MNTSTLRYCLAFLIAAGLSCDDQGDVVNYLEIVDLQPAPNSTHVDKAALVQIHSNRTVNLNQAEKVRLRYVDDTASVNSYVDYGMTGPLVDFLFMGPFIWKPGRTVEVAIPKEISDPEGNSLKQALTYQFTIVGDTVPFDVIDALPIQDDTISLSAYPLSVPGSLLFSDYVYVRDSVLTISPMVSLSMTRVVVIDGRNQPMRRAWFAVRNLQPYTTYTITVPRTIRDYEGEMLARDHHLVFHTKP